MGGRWWEVGGRARAVWRSAALFFLCTFADEVDAQARFPMKYIGEVGHLGAPDERTEVDLGIAKVFADPRGDLRFEGRDVVGKSWRVWIPQKGGIGGTDVWGADFDRNGRKDLVIAEYFPPNGRCVDRTDIYTLMFDELGRPVPWVAQSSTFTDFGRPPVPLVRRNRDGPAEIVIVGCEYSEPDSGFSEDRRITGIYEATNAIWRPLRNVPEGPYVTAAKRHTRRSSPLGGVHRDLTLWLSTDPLSWPDFFAGYDSQPTEQIESLIAADPRCGPIPPLLVVDGRVVGVKQDDPCTVGRRNRIVYSDDKIRAGWPPVVIDSPEGRDIYLSKPEVALREIQETGYRVKLLGNPAAPDLLWVEAPTRLK